MALFNQTRRTNFRLIQIKIQALWYYEMHCDWPCATQSIFRCSINSLPSDSYMRQKPNQSLVQTLQWSHNGSMASQSTNLTIVNTTVYSGADQRKHQSSASLAFVRGIHQSPVKSPHKRPVTRKMFPFDEVIMDNGLSPIWLQAIIWANVWNFKGTLWNSTQIS